MRFGVLGPLEVRGPGGELIPVGGPRPRAVLVMLLLNAGQVVGVEALIDGQYGEDPPAGAANAVQAQVSRLRRALGAGRIEFRGGGYLLAVDPGTVDAHRFERLARQGRHLVSAGRFEDAAGTLRQALGLWRGPALPDLPFGQAQAARLEELRLTAGEDLAEAELALPGSAPVAELRRLVSAHPLRERLRAQLMRALHAAGRQAEALAAFEEGRRLLADELGADPSPELAAAHLAVLRAEPPAPAPRRLPAQLTSFVGREHDLALLASPGSRLRTIVGPGGIGKTRLAIEAAARDSRETYFADLSPLPPPKAQDSAAPRPTPTDAEAAWDALPPTGVEGSAAAGSYGVEQVARVVLGALGVREGGLRTPQLRRSRPALGVGARRAGHGARPGQLRTSHRLCRRTGPHAAGRVSPAVRPGHQPRAAGHHRRSAGAADAAGHPPSRTPRPPDRGHPPVRLPGRESSDGRHAGGGRAWVSGRAAVRRPGGSRAAGVRGAAGQRGRGGADLRHAGRAAAGHRAGGGAAAVVRRRGDRRAAGRAWPVPAAVPRRPYGARRGTGRCARWWSGAGTCSPPRNRRWPGGSRCSPEARRSRRSKPCASGPPTTLPGCWRIWWTSRWSSVDGGRYRMLETIRLFCAERLAEAGEEDGVRGRHAAGT